MCLIRFYIGFVFGFLSNSVLTPRKITCNVFGMEDDFHARANEKQTKQTSSRKTVGRRKRKVMASGQTETQENHSGEEDPSTPANFSSTGRAS